MRLIILGAGGFGHCVREAAIFTKKYEEILFLDDNAASCPVGKLHDFRSYLDADTFFIPAFGNDKLRISWIETLISSNANVATIIHPYSFVSPSATIGLGTVVMPMSVVNTGTHIGVGCIIDTGSIVDHDCNIGTGIHVKPGAIIRPNNCIPDFIVLNSGQVVESMTY